MSWEEVRQLAKKEGYAEGVSDGIVQGISRGRSTLQDIILEHLATLGEIPEELRIRITSETDMDVLKAMTTALFSAGSISEFEALISNLS